MADTNLAQAVEVANAASSYDTNIKFHWSDAIKEISFVTLLRG